MMARAATSARLSDLTWAEASERFARGAVVVVPIGAAAKEHGPHLPLDTDRRIAEALAERVGTLLPIVIAPTIAFGYYPVFIRYAGSQHLQSATFQALVTDLLDGFIRQGVRRLALINTGVSTEAPLRLAVRAVFERHGVAVATADYRALGHGVRHLWQQASGGHADEAETSLMLAIAPEVVRLDRARADHEPPRPRNVFHRPVRYTPTAEPEGEMRATGGDGDPTLATPEKGTALLIAMVDDLVAGLRASFPGAFD
ncbi:MAG: creatininase family protein [Alphaproteobacteria bacterium]|nr:creatininase family protein [Alphaproteobacteria bacterium]